MFYQHHLHVPELVDNLQALLPLTSELQKLDGFPMTELTERHEQMTHVVKKFLDL